MVMHFMVHESPEGTVHMTTQQETVTLQPVYRCTSRKAVAVDIDHHVWVATCARQDACFPISYNRWSTPGSSGMHAVAHALQVQLGHAVWQQPVFSGCMNIPPQIRVR